MNTALSKILSHVYELEGLLLVADHHGSDTPPVVYDLIREHARKLHEMSALLPNESHRSAAPAPEPAPVPEPASEPEPAAVVATAPETEPETPADSPADTDITDDDIPPRSDDDELRPAFSFSNCESRSEDDEPAVPTPMDAFDALTPEDDEPAVPTPMDAFDALTPEDDELDDATTATMGQRQDALRVDEKLQRTLSKDLRKAFSVNDRFRFRRELFGNSEADFVDAINMIESMHSYDEAREYFLDDLGWDEDVAEVSEFLAIVRHHFA